MKHYIFFVWSDSDPWKFGTLVVTSSPETLGQRILKHSVNKKVDSLHRMGLEKLKITLLDVLTNKQAIPYVKKLLTTALADKGFVMSQKARTESSESELHDVDIEAHSLSVKELVSDYKNRMPEYVEWRLNRLT